MDLINYECNNGKKCGNPEIFIRIIRLLIISFTVIINLLNKGKRELVVVNHWTIKSMNCIINKLLLKFWKTHVRNGL